MTVLARAGLAAALGAAVPFAQAQSGPFTEQQAAAGRASYLANCAGCHQPDLRGANEAKPLAGPDFMRTWGERTSQDLVAFLSAAMPPPPASPGGLGTQTYVNLAAFVLAANGATPGNTELAATTAVRIGSVAAGAMSDAFRAALASAVPAGTSVGGRTGSSRCSGSGP
jgi:alcohol dehydrogenase (cytochrome c)